MPTRPDRVERINALQEARGGTTVISYVTSTRANLEAQMAMDAIPVIHRHLEAIGTPKAETNIDLFIHSNGGDGTVPWRLVTLIREYCSKFSVLVPHRAFSAATLTALGADEVVMHPMGMLGPIDPTISGPFNPPNPQNQTQNLGISVEDVASYINLVKDDVGIGHEDELVQAFAILARKVHPLALGNVKRATQQSRMMGDKLLRQQLESELDPHEAEEIIEKLTSKLFFHGHPINRREARDELRLNFVAEDVPANVESAMWGLYELYADDMRLNDEFQPLQEALAAQPVPLPPAPQMAGAGQYGGTHIGIANAQLGPYRTAFVESAARTDCASMRFEATVRREWTGATALELLLLESGWSQET